MKWVKIIHGNTRIEMVLYSKRHQNTHIERERERESETIVLLGFYATFVVWALTFWDSVSFPFSRVKMSRRAQ
jgi:hypothetical protein